MKNLRVSLSMLWQRRPDCGAPRATCGSLASGDEINGKNVIYARQRHVWVNAMYGATGDPALWSSMGKRHLCARRRAGSDMKSRVVCLWQRPGLRGTARSRAGACIRATRRHQWKRTSSMRGNVTYGRIPCIRAGEFCAVVTYGKNVTYALAGSQDSKWLSHRRLVERPAPHCGATARARRAPASGLRAVIYARARHL